MIYLKSGRSWRNMITRANQRSLPQVTLNLPVGSILASIFWKRISPPSGQGLHLLREETSCRGWKSLFLRWIQPSGMPFKKTFSASGISIITSKCADSPPRSSYKVSIICLKGMKKRDSRLSVPFLTALRIRIFPDMTETCHVPVALCFGSERWCMTGAILS